MTFALNKILGTDEKAEVEGIWQDIGHGAKVRVARAGNPRFKEAQTKIRKEHSMALTFGTLSKEDEDRIDIEVQAKTILLDIKGICLNEGDPELENTLENRIALLQNKDFNRLVIQISLEIENYRKVEEEKGKK